MKDWSVKSLKDIIGYFKIKLLFWLYGVFHFMMSAWLLQDIKNKEEKEKTSLAMHFLLLILI